MTHLKIYVLKLQLTLTMKWNCAFTVFYCDIIISCWPFKTNSMINNHPNCEVCAVIQFKTAVNAMATFTISEAKSF